jgi:uncharacterized protein (DUF433 family)
MFQGSIYLGEGFLLNDEKKAEMIAANSRNSEVIFGLLSGRDVNESYLQKPSSNIINFFDWTENRAKTYEYPYLRLKELVKPERDKQNRKANRDKWWIYAERRPGLIGALSKAETCFITLFTSKYLNFSEASTSLVFTNGINVLASERYYYVCFLQSNIHLEWARKYGSTLKNDLRYTPTKCFETFPFPKVSQSFEIELEQLGKEFLSFRRDLMVLLKSGLTKIYNLFHNKALKIEDIRKETNQLDEVCKKAYDDIITLRQFHKNIDDAVLKAYGWEDINLLHGFYDIEYLPEKDRVRYAIHPDARKEILKRLLELNHELYEQEIIQGLHSRESVETFYLQKGVPVPTEVLTLLDKNKKEKIAVAKMKKVTIANKEDIHRQGGMYEMPNLFNSGNDMKEFSLHEGIYSVKDAAEITRMSAAKIKRWFGELYKENYEGIDTQHQVDVANFRISFHGLIELVIIGTLRDAGASLKKILTARKDLGAKTSTVYPFASNDASKLHLSGRDIVFDFHQDVMVTLDGKSQINLGFITEFFKDIVFELGVAQRISFAKYNHKIIIDPKIGGGKPSIRDKSVWVELINSFYSGPESIPMIKQQYSLDEDEVLAAIEFTK